MKRRVILGSGSPRRKEILENAGIEFEIVVSDCEEKVEKKLPAEIVMELSLLKAQDVYKNKLDGNSDGLLIIGADTIVAYEDRIFGKPKDRMDAVNMLSVLSGRTHHVFTGVTLLYDGLEHTFYSDTAVTFYPLEREEIEAYVDTGEPMDKAGAYGIQGGMAKYIKEIQGEYLNVVGFPIAAFIHELKELGIELA